jgi:hypothetical protein
LHLEHGVLARGLDSAVPMWQIQETQARQTSVVPHMCVRLILNIQCQGKVVNVKFGDWWVPCTAQLWIISLTAAIRHKLWDNLCYLVNPLIHQDPGHGQTPCPFVSSVDNNYRIPSNAVRVGGLLQSMYSGRKATVAFRHAERNGG